MAATHITKTKITKVFFTNRKEGPLTSLSFRQLSPTGTCNRHHDISSSNRSLEHLARYIGGNDGCLGVIQDDFATKSFDVASVHGI
jgi:hypothetical protein